MAATRETRKTIPGINVGGGFVHVPGTPWPEDKWEAFKEWAHQNGATSDARETSCRWKTGEDYHREDGPALIFNDGYMMWLVNNQHHRVGGPAIVGDGNEEWYQNDKEHRLDGPAVIFYNGKVRWWKDGIRYTDETFTERYQE